MIVFGRAILPNLQIRQWVSRGEIHNVSNGLLSRPNTAVCRIVASRPAGGVRHFRPASMQAGGIVSPSNRLACSTSSVVAAVP